jgi:hypothetical protein
MNGDGFGPATYVRAGELDNRNGISPAVTFAAVAAVGTIAARIFGLPAALDAAVTAGEYSLSGLLSATEENTVKNAFDAEGAQAQSAQIEAFAAFLNLQDEQTAGGKTIQSHVGKTNDELEARARAENRPRIGTFPDEATATRFTSMNLTTNVENIRTWLNDPASRNQQWFEFRLDSVQDASLV